jgi:putative membrane protein
MMMDREKGLYIGFGFILLLLGVSFVYQGGSLWGPCRMSGYGDQAVMGSGMHRGGAGFFGLGFHGFGLLFWLLVVFFIVLVFTNGRRGEGAMDILNKRYARGEISREEYLRMKDEMEEK